MLKEVSYELTPKLKVMLSGEFELQEHKRVETGLG